MDAVTAKANWETEFGTDYTPPSVVLQAIADGTLVDESWHNDMCPHFRRSDANVVIWIEHLNWEMREHQNEGDGRYIVSRWGNEPGDDLYDGDDIDKALSVLFNA